MVYRAFDTLEGIVCAPVCFFTDQNYSEAQSSMFMPKNGLHHQY